MLLLSLLLLRTTCALKSRSSITARIAVLLLLHAVTAVSCFVQLVLTVLLLLLLYTTC
jgi:hypothetical protein